MDRSKNTRKRFARFLVFTLLILPSSLLAADYQLDPDHSEIGFAIRHLGINTVRGAYKDFRGGFNVDTKNNLLAARVEIVAASIDTRVEKRDNHLRSPDFLEVIKFPGITFTSTSITHDADGSYAVTGTLTIKGISKEVQLNGDLSGPIIDPWGKQRMGIALRGTVDRCDFGLTYNGTLNSGVLLIDTTVNIFLEGEGILSP